MWGPLASALQIMTAQSVIHVNGFRIFLRENLEHLLLWGALASVSFRVGTRDINFEGLVHTPRKQCLGGSQAPLSRANMAHTCLSHPPDDSLIHVNDLRVVVLQATEGCLASVFVRDGTREVKSEGLKTVAGECGTCSSMGASCLRVADQDWQIGY